jgi:hypothetical protein
MYSQWGVCLCISKHRSTGTRNVLAAFVCTTFSVHHVELKRQGVFRVISFMRDVSVLVIN